MLSLGLLGGDNHQYQDRLLCSSCFWALSPPAHEPPTRCRAHFRDRTPCPREPTEHFDQIRSNRKLCNGIIRLAGWYDRDPSLWIFLAVGRHPRNLRARRLVRTRDADVWDTHAIVRSRDATCWCVCQVCQEFSHALSPKRCGVQHHDGSHQGRGNQLRGASTQRRQLLDLARRALR